VTHIDVEQYEIHSARQLLLSGGDARGDDHFGSGRLSDNLAQVQCNERIVFDNQNRGHQASRLCPTTSNSSRSSSFQPRNASCQGVAHVERGYIEPCAMAR
jgi:hypothetical protein